MDGELDWLDEFGLGQGCMVGWENEEKAIPAEVGVRGLVEGLVVGLEVSTVVPSGVNRGKSPHETDVVSMVDVRL